MQKRILAPLSNLHSCGAWRWCEKVGPETPGLHVQTRPGQDSAACPRTKPKAAPESKDFPLTNDREITPKLEIRLNWDRLYLHRFNFTKLNILFNHTFYLEAP